MGRPKKSTTTEEPKLTNANCPCKACKNKEIVIGTAEISPEDLFIAANAAGTIVYDLETTSLSWQHGRIEGVAFYVPAVKNNKTPIHAWYPFTENSFVKYVDGVPTSLRPAMPHAETMERLRPIFESKDILKISANGKFDDAWLIENPGTEKPIHVAKPKGDSMLADYLSDERRRRYGLKVRVQEVFGHIMTTYEEASQRQGMFSFMCQEPLGSYAASDCVWTYRLHQYALEEMKRQDPAGKLEKIYWNIEMPLRDIITQIETTGILLDYDHLIELSERLENEKAEIFKEIVNTAGWAPNLRSPTQVSDFLYNSPEDGGLGLPTDGLEEGADGSYSTAEKVIAHFGRKDKLVNKLLKYRSLEVIDRSFCQKLIKIAQEDGRVRAGFSQTGTVIGRLSCIAEDSMINTNHGDLNIVDIPEEEVSFHKVLTHKGNMKRIISRYYKGDATMFEVTLVNGKKIKCTKEHRFFTQNGPKALADLKPGDQILEVDDER